MDIAKEEWVAEQEQKQERSDGVVDGDRTGVGHLNAIRTGAPFTGLWFPKCDTSGSGISSNRFTKILFS